MNPIIRCKMRVAEVLHRKESDGSTSQEVVKLHAVMANTPENKEWSRWTPSANFEIYINNPAAMGKLSSGHEFFVDFTSAADLPKPPDPPIPPEPVGT